MWDCTAACARAQLQLVLVVGVVVVTVGSAAPCCLCRLLTRRGRLWTPHGPSPHRCGRACIVAGVQHVPKLTEDMTYPNPVSRAGCRLLSGRAEAPYNGYP